MKLNDIEPKFKELEKRLNAVEQQAHTHQDAEPPTLAEEAGTEAAEAAAEGVTELFTRDAEDAGTGSAVETETSEPEPETEEAFVDEDASFRVSEAETETQPTGDLKVDIQNDLKSYSATIVGNALMNQVCLRNGNTDFCRHEALVMETGKTKRVQPFVTTDATYEVLSREMFDRALKETEVDKIKWVAEEMDCEKIAREFVDVFAEIGVTDSVGRIFAASGEHAFNVVLVQNGESVDILFVEPQTDEYVEPVSFNPETQEKQNKYNIYDALIVLS